MHQEQFLEVVDRDEAERRVRGAVRMSPRGSELCALIDALGRVLAEDVISPVDVPGFDRANVDGFAVRAADTFGAFEESPRRVRLNREVLRTAVVPAIEVANGTATAIATGGMMPRGADAVVMVEHTDPLGAEDLLIRRPVAPGSGVAFAGTDIARGETVLRRGTELSARSAGVLAAIGVDRVAVFRRPRVAIFSTGDEVVAAGQPLAPGQIHDSNATLLAGAVLECGGEPILLGIVGDEAAAVRAMLDRALGLADIVLLSGGTSKGAGDLNYHVLAEHPAIRILAHGVALKPGKPICLAAAGDRPVVVLPGFPTSAIFTFHELVAGVIRAQAGRQADLDPELATARLAIDVHSEKGRTEYLLVGLVAGDAEPAAYPMGKGSGSVTTFSSADGFITIDRQVERLEAGAMVSVHLLGRRAKPADLVVIGSHCTGLDMLLGLAAERGLASRVLAVGSQGGLAAARRGECDLAGIHLLDPATGIYNRAYCEPDLELVPGYGRMQGIVFRRDDARFAGAQEAHAAAQRALADPSCILMNRNRGSGTRVLVDQLLAGRQPRGFAAEGRSHNAVAAAVAAGRADWGVAIATVATAYGLGFLPLVAERYDLAVPRARLARPAVRVFLELLRTPEARARLAAMGFLVDDEACAG